VADYPIFRGWGLFERAGRKLKQSITYPGIANEARRVELTAQEVQRRLAEDGLDTMRGREAFATGMARQILEHLGADPSIVDQVPFFERLADCLFEMIENEALFDTPELFAEDEPALRSRNWEMEDKLKRTAKVLTNLDEAIGGLCGMLEVAVAPIIKQHPALIEPKQATHSELSFETRLLDNLTGLPELIEQMVQLPFAPQFDEFQTTLNLKARLEHNLIAASQNFAGDLTVAPRSYKMPTRAAAASADKLVDTYLGGTPFAQLFDCVVDIAIPLATRFEHHHIVAGSGHGKTQTLQHFILHDLEAVASGKRSIVVIDSQSDLINNIAGLSLFAPGGPLAGRLVLIDPTDVEYPVALNLFDAGLDRLKDYSQLDREKLTNSVLELYDFVLGSLLDAGMTQKQTIIFRYITRLLLHIPDATIHTFRELLEEDGYETYRTHIEKLSGSARAFFDNEFQGSEFKSTRKQVLRRLYGILENQTFERMFSHPRSKLDLFTEMNSGKVILINTAKDLLKENGTEIFGRFFIAMIAQAAQERAVLSSKDRLPTLVYVDEANDYFDRNIGIILSQARKYNIGMVLAHQYLGQLDTRLQEAISANTAIKFAGGVSAKDARSVASEMRTEATMIEQQKKLSFAAFIKGTTNSAVSIGVDYGEMERLGRLTSEEKQSLLDDMRERYAVHYKQLNGAGADPEAYDDGDGDPEPPDGEPPEGSDPSGETVDAPDADVDDKHDEDDGKPMRWD